MGVDAADFDEDGNLDLVLSNFKGERFSLYHNDGQELFSDWATQTPIGEATRVLAGGRGFLITTMTGTWT